MSVFIYQATDKSGKLVEGTMEGKDEGAVVSRLYSSQLRPITIKPDNSSGLQAGGIFSFSLFRRVREKDILAFTQKLATLLNAGLNLDRSLSIIIELNEKEKMRVVAENIQKNVHGGTSLADAVSRHPDVFSKLYVSMIKAGEEGGVLEVILDRLSGFMETSEKLRNNLISAMIYPIVLTLAGGGSVTILMTFVVPKFARIFSDMGQAIPVSTMVLLSISAFLSSYWWVLILGIIALILILKAYFATKIGRLMRDSLLLKIPIVGTIQGMVQVSRFTRTLGTLIKSGVPILKALSITGETLTNVVVSRSMGGILKKIKGGGGISEPLQQSGVFPPLAVHMIQIGEETGKLDDMLLKVADTYDEDIENAVKRFITLIEPAMILFMGIVVGFIVISILLAIFSMNDLPI